LRIGPACEAGLSAGMRRERVPPRIRKKERRWPQHSGFFTQNIMAKFRRVLFNGASNASEYGKNGDLSQKRFNIGPSLLSNAYRESYEIYRLPVCQSFNGLE